MQYVVFPTEALLLGECLGEYETSGGFFLDYVRHRLLPMMPSYVEHKTVEGLGVFKDESKRSLLDMILQELDESVSASSLDKQFGFHPEYPVLRAYMQLIAEMAPSSEEGQRFTSLLNREKHDDHQAIETLLVRIASECHQDRLMGLGRAFGAAIASCEQMIEFLAEPQGIQRDDTFELGTYVSKEELVQLSEQLNKTVPGVTFELLSSAGAQIHVPYDLLDDDSRERAVSHASRLLGALWLAFGEAIGAVREWDVFARIEDSHSPTPRAYRLTARSEPDAVREAIRSAEQSLADVGESRRSAESVVRELAPAIEALSRRIWPNFEEHDGLASLLYAKLKSQRTYDRRFASTALTLYKVYRNEANHDMDGFRCTFAESRYFAAGIRSLLELSDLLCNQRLA